MATLLDLGHHIRGIAPILDTMAGLGFSAAQCLQGTGLTLDDLTDPAGPERFSLAAEFTLYRNILRLTADRAHPGQGIFLRQLRYVRLCLFQRPDPGQGHGNFRELRRLDLYPVPYRFCHRG